MARFSTRETEPFKRWNGRPIYLTTIVAAVMVLGLLFSAVLESLRSPLLLRLMFVLPENDLNWLAAVTYPLIDRFSFFTPFMIFIFYWAAVGIETHLGRAALTRTLVAIILVPVALGIVLWSVFDVSVWLRGNYLLLAGIIVAFGTLYPSLELWNWIPFKWVAFACLLCGSFMALAQHDWGTLAGLWGAAGAAFLVIRRAVEADNDDYIPVTTRVKSLFRKKPRLRVVPKPSSAARPAPVRPIAEEPDLEIDALLDKIAKSGLASLSNAEKAKLERARQELLKKEQT